jgi:hypothetical protein
MNWLKKRPRDSETPISIEKRVVEQDWPKYFAGWKEEQIEVGEPYTDRFGETKIDQRKKVLKTKDPQIKKDNENGPSPADSFNADLFKSFPKQPDGQDWAYWPVVTDY